MHYNRLERLARDKHSSLLGRYISYEENEVVELFSNDKRPSLPPKSSNHSEKSFLNIVFRVTLFTVKLFMGVNNMAVL
jgi:hypothetical protein